MTKLPEGVRDGALAAGGLAVAAFLLYAFYPASPPEPASAAAAAPATLAAPPPAPAAAAPVPASANGLRLIGLLGGGAIIAAADGAQRWVALGRDALPGLKVERIEQQHVVLASAAGEIRLGFDGASAPQPAGNTALAARDSSETAQEETLRYRLGLVPPRPGQRGFTVRPGASMPALEQAGLRPGDVIMGVNGGGFGEDQMLELAWTIANSTRTEFEVVRGGRRIRLALEDGGR